MPEATLSDLVELIAEKQIADPSKPAAYIGLEHIPERAIRLDKVGTTLPIRGVCVRFRAGDILFGKLRPNLRKSVLAPVDGSGSTEILVLRPKNGVDASFAGHVLRSETVFFEAERMTEGTRMPRTSWKTLSSIEVFAPSDTSAQKLIAHILDAIDNAVLETDSLVSKLLLIHQGLVHDLTRLGVSENGDTRRAERAAEFRETELGLLPLSWGVDSVGRLANDLALGTAARGMTDGKDQLRLLKMGNLGWDTLDTSICEMIDVQRVVRWRDAVLLDGDLLFNTRNTPELVGKTAAYDQEDRKTVCDNNILRIRFPGEKMDGRFAAAYMANGLGKARLLALATGTTSVAAIYWRDLRHFKLPVPPREEREEIVRRLGASRDRIRRERDFRAKISDLREGLRDDLLSGRKPVVAIREAPE
jgi:type I restriction enzyme, S subunit